MSKNFANKENFLFSKVYAKGKKASEKTITVYALRNYRSSDTLLGITTGKKIGNAVNRSRARRLIREAFRSSSEGKTWRKPFWIVVVARGFTTDKKCKTSDVRRDMEKAFLKLNLFVEER